MVKIDYYRIFSALLPRTPFKLSLARKSKLFRHLLSYFVIYLACLVVVLLALLSLVSTVLSSTKMEREMLQDKLVHWESIAKRYSNFPDAYYNASYYAFKLNNKQLAMGYIEKALFLDPGFEKAKQLRLELIK